jgi:hypothetical protein
MVENPWYMLCWSAKWLGEKKIYSSALVDFPEEYKKNPESDVKILKTLWDLLDEADIVIAHNGRKFDVRKANARFIMNNMPPPSPYKIIDTLSEARKHFFFTSNKLGDLGKYLGVGTKMDTGGFELWRQCMYGNKKAWKKMVSYCKQDIKVLERVYLKLRPYMNTHPNLGVYTEELADGCPKCSSQKIQKRGFLYTNVAKYQRYQCTDCGGWFKDRTNLKEIKVKTVN